MENQFDKFMDDIEKREAQRRAAKKSQEIAENAWPARKLREKYQEKPENRIVWSR